MITKEITRRLFGWFTGISAAVCLVVTLYIVATVKISSGIPPLAFNDVTSKSIETRLGLAQTLFQLTILMIGALWGLLIAKKDEIKLVFAQYSEVVMFISASAVLLLSISAYAFYLNKLSSQFADAGSLGNLGETLYIPDIFDQNINYLFILQIVGLIVGTVNGLLTLLSTHRLR
jgi:hypothetical protein